MAGADDDIERVFRREYGRAMAVLTRATGDIGLAEESVQEAFTIAVRRWPEDGVPPSPVGWIISTARRRAIDRLRREAIGRDKLAAVARLAPGPGPVPGEGTDLEDDRLRLIFTCCHPALAEPARVALTLRLLGGLSTAEIARAFLVGEATMAQRLVRAKGKIRDTRIPYTVPARAELPERLASVLAVVYLIFNEGHTASGGPDLSREGLCEEAVRLGRLLAGLMPDEDEVVGLLALMLLVESRRPARTVDGTRMVPLVEQDRTRWDHDLITEGQALVRQCLQRNRPGPYQLQAAIQAVHSDAADAAATDWPQIVALYDHLLLVSPTPVVALHRAVAVGEVEGPEVALALVDGLPLDRYPRHQAVRADLLARLGRAEEAATAYRLAMAGTENAVELAHLEERLSALTRGGAPGAGGP